MPFSGAVTELLHFKDHHNEARLFATRVFASSILLLLLFGLLIGRFYYLQVLHYQDYTTQADANRIHVQPVPPTRGLIYDRQGVLLADNRPSFTLSLVRERVKDLPETVATLRELLEISDDDVADFHKALAQRRRPFEAVPLKYQLTEDDIARIAVNEYRLDGVEVDAQLVRYYPYGDLFAHVVGYTGRITEQDLRSFDEETYNRYSGTHSIGKVGLEKSYELTLLGKVGDEHIETNAHGRVLRVLERTPPEPGEELHLFIDARLQQAGYDVLDGRRGSVVALDVKTGGVLAMVSAPSYDPNLFVTGISYKAYEQLRESLDLPLYNRSIQGQYPPASTVKPMLGLAGLKSSTVTSQTKIYDPGYFQLPGEERLYREWKRGGHGRAVDLHEAITQSCDIFFYKLGYEMGIETLHRFGSQFGLGTKTGIDIPAERSGLWPSREWKRADRRLPWYPGDSLNVSIGQGFALATPLQIAVMTATLASRGKHKKPRLVERIGTTPTELEVINQVEAEAEDWDYVLNAMKDVVHGIRGTAHSMARGLGYTMAGKTGTAQVVGIAQDARYDSEMLAERHRDHTLFIGFAPVEDPRIAVAVIIENGEHGASNVARAMLDAYMALDDDTEETDAQSQP